MTKFILILKLRQKLQDLLSFQNFVINSSKLAKSDFGVLNLFLGDFISKIDTLFTPSAKLLNFSRFWRESQESGKSLGFGHSQNYKEVFNGSIIAFFGDLRIVKFLHKAGTNSKLEFFTYVSDWLSNLRFYEISNLKRPYINQKRKLYMKVSKITLEVSKWELK